MEAGRIDVEHCHKTEHGKIEFYLLSRSILSHLAAQSNWNKIVCMYENDYIITICAEEKQRIYVFLKRVSTEAWNAMHAHRKKFH